MLDLAHIWQQESPPNKEGSHLDSYLTATRIDPGRWHLPLMAQISEEACLVRIPRLVALMRIINETGGLACCRGPQQRLLDRDHHFS